MAKKIDYAALFTMRKDGRYQGYTYDENGKRHAVCDRDPERLWHRLNDPPEDMPVTFKQVAEAWEREHREEIEVRTWKNYEPHYNQMIADHGKEPFSALAALDVVNELKAAKAQGLSATVVRTKRSLYNMIFDYAVVHGHAQYNPIGSVKLPKGLKHGKRKAPTYEQMQTILKSWEVPGGLFALLLLCTGLRKSEALALQWADIDFKAKEISIIKSIDYTNGANPKFKAPKTENSVRDIPIVDILLGPLQEAERHKTSDYVFPAPPSNRGGPGGGLMPERAYEGMWQRYCEAVGLIVDGKPAITAHNLRHGTATIMFEQQVDELTAQKILGHSRIEITREIYTDLREKQKIKSIDAFNAGMAEMMAKNKKD